MASSLVCVTNHNHKQQSDTLRRGHILLQTQNQNEVFLELVDTERTYVKDLGILVNGLLVPLRRSLRESLENGQEPILSEEQIKTLFMNVEDLLKHHKGLLHRVEWIMLWSGPYTKASTLGNLFSQECQFFRDYRPFLEGYNSALTLFETLKATNTAFANLLAEFDATRHRNGEMAFESILITPAQRIPRYELMFRELSRHLADNREVRDAQDYVSKTMRLLEDASSAAAVATAASSRSTLASSRAKPALSQKDKEEMALRRRSLSIVNASSSSFMKKMRRKSTQISSVLLSSSSPASTSCTSTTASTFPSTSPSVPFLPSAVPCSSSSSSTSSSSSSSFSAPLALALSASDSQVTSKAGMPSSSSSSPPSSSNTNTSPRSPSSSSEFLALAEEDTSSGSPPLSSSSGGRPTRPSLFKNFSRKLRRKDVEDADMAALPLAAAAAAGGASSGPTGDNTSTASHKNRSWRNKTKPKEGDL